MIDLSGLSDPLRWEVAYAIQARHDQRTCRTTPEVANRVIRFLRTAGRASLREGDEQSWARAYRKAHRGDSNGQGLLVDAHRKVIDLAAGTGWDREFPLDRWQLRRLGYPGNTTLDFGGITQPWLQESAKRWVRARMSTGLGLEASRRGLRAVTRLAGYLDHTGLTEPEQLTRNVVEGYLADLAAAIPTVQQRQVHLGQLRVFLEAVRQHQWAPIDATAAVYAQDNPRRPQRGPRALSEHVMAQLETPQALAAWDDPVGQLITTILIRCGLRISDATGLPYDCLVTDTAGGAYLRYRNHKMNREALVPIDEELQDLIKAQQARLATGSTPPPVLFPRPTNNPDKVIPLAHGTYRYAMYQWLKALSVHDEHGHLVHLTPHQWRHTLGTRLVNQDVPQEVVRRILDHDSPLMTAHYARIHDDTVRRHWQAARKVDITGATITPDPDGPLSDAAWASHRLSTATQALPNGYCALPVQKTCPHANACLTCPMFLTTPEHLPAHREHRTQVIELITRAEAEGRTRVAGMNQQVLTSLDAIITALEQPEDPDAS